MPETATTGCVALGLRQPPSVIGSPASFVTWLSPYSGSVTAANQLVVPPKPMLICVIGLPAAAPCQWTASVFWT